MILETDVGDTQCSEQIADVQVPQIADRIVETHTKWWRRSVKDSQSPAASC